MLFSSPTVCIFTLICLIIDLVICQKTKPIDFYFNRGGRVNMVQKDWMSSLNDSIHLNHLSIPGTHDTMAFYGGPFVQTQVLSLDIQLRVGIRAFDIRCRHVNDIFEIHHGPIYQRSDMDKVLQSMVNFLGNFPSEVLLVRIKEESAPSDNSRSFSDTVDYYLNKPTFRSYIWTGNSTVPLGHVRGKIVILRNYPSKQLLGVPWDRTLIQDDYIVPTVFSIGSKWIKVQEHLERARLSAYQSDTFVINFLSGTSPGAYPCTIARRINRYILDWLQKYQVDYIGIIYMDFPGEGLISSIIRLNSGIHITNGLGDDQLDFTCNEDQEKHQLNPINLTNIQTN
ncbi:1-phosphatidylinositol phosphodiesterase-like [Panonychus citri]|uniref:1-phosphatidylinositol phosphodiesterase-like n=1 Tax=Panonychus citri TaxID=50023 RepID=UPI0023080073|nr:1-phosphatidylinositol phosphodiesterase-like [Panonychus citri]